MFMGKVKECLRSTDKKVIDTKVSSLPGIKLMFYSNKKTKKYE